MCVCVRVCVGVCVCVCADIYFSMLIGEEVAQMNNSVEFIRSS